jgi:amino acid adenylation domain-containing protein
MPIADVSSTSPLVTRLETTAKRFPNRLALKDEFRTVTFSEFFQEVSTLASKIQTKIKPGDHVAVQLRRGLDYAVSAYAIWQAGGVYLPLDDQWPKSRIDGILSQTHVRLLIHASEKIHTIELTTLINDSQVQWLESSAVGTPAYIIHTSGTTGVPKGVVISHESLLHLVDSHQRDIYQPHGVTEGPVVMNASFCFDSALERLALVAIGYSLHVVSDPIRKSPLELVNYLRDHQIVNVDLVPSHLKVLLNAGLSEKVTTLQLVIVGGEAIDNDLWQNLASHQATYINVYGPTENTINTTFCVIRGKTPHIGRPFKNVTCMIVNEEGQLCEDGEAGELFIAGKHLSLGYYNAQELTSKAFVSFNEQRCYRTGDLVQRDNQGNLLFLGRIDDQVKINGYRIELSDVQHHLSQLDGVKYAAITPLKLSSGQSLLASIVWDSKHDLVFSQLSAQLSEKLPAYMVPGHWQRVDALPLTDNLKLDHKALIYHWQSRQNEIGDDTSGKLSITERRIQCIWQQILQRSSISPDTHFFSSGGDSLTAMTLLLELNKVVSRNLSLGDIFKYPTIRKMATWLDTIDTQKEI